MFNRTGNGVELTSIFLVCSIPVSIDIYPVCTFNCLYCFGKKSFSSGTRNKLKSPNPDDLNKLLENSLKEEPKQIDYRSDFVKWYIHNRKAIQVGVVSDPFDYLEYKYGYSYEILETFSKYKYPLRISTKGILYAKNKYLNLFKENLENWKLAISLFTKNEEVLRKVEPRGFSYSKRLKAIEKAVKNGVDVVIRFGPYIPTINEDWKEIINDLASIGVKDFQLRNFEKSPFLTVNEKKNYAELGKLAKIDLDRFCEKYVSKERFGELSYTKSIEYSLKFKKECEKHRLNFYVQSDTSKITGCAENCCAVKDKYSLHDYNLSSALFIARKNGTVKYEDVAPNFNKILGSIPTNNTCFFSKSVDNPLLSDLFKNIWNNPQKRQGLTKRYGYHLIPAGKDENGNIIYRIDENRLEKYEIKEKKE